MSSLTNITGIACGYQIVFLDIDGNVYTSGGNEYGQLGVGKDRNTLKLSGYPLKVNLPRIKQVTCGIITLLFVYLKMEIYILLEVMNLVNLVLEIMKVLTLPKVETVQDVDFIECGEYHSICKTNSGEFYCWGRNNHGQLGIGNSDNQKLLFQCLNWQDIVDIKCGAFHTLALTTNQEVYSCGENLSGQLGRLANDDSALKLLQVEELSNIIIIRCGSSHSMCVDIHNNLFLFGDNTFGQLGFGDSVNRIKPEIHSNLQQIIDVSSGGYHTFVKTISNEVIAFGWNDSEQLGIETKYKYQFNPITLSKDIENIWCSNINKKSSAKSARK